MTPTPLTETLAMLPLATGTAGKFVPATIPTGVPPEVQQVPSFTQPSTAILRGAVAETTSVNLAFLV